MSTSVNAYTSANNGAAVLQTAGTQSGSATQIRPDSEIISKVVSTEIRPSKINETVQPSKESMEKIAADLQKFVQAMGRNLNFTVDDTTGYHVVKVVNPTTGELVRQLPSEELLKVARDFERLHAALVSQRA